MLDCGIGDFLIDGRPEKRNINILSVSSDVIPSTFDQCRVGLGSNGACR